jgi:RHS repeat-associated protein
MYDIWGYPVQVQETVHNPFRYSGELWDDTIGLQYLRARWYDPKDGRFISEDTYKGDITNPLSLNLYTYVHNNPLIYIDPSGHYCVSADGNWAHEGSCNSATSIYMGEDRYNEAAPIIENGYLVGYISIFGNPIYFGKPEGQFNYWTMLAEMAAAKAKAEEEHRLKEQKALEQRLKMQAFVEDISGYSAIMTIATSTDPFATWNAMASFIGPPGARRFDGTGKTGLKSFDDIAANPKYLYGKTADEVAEILGDGWKRGTYGSSGTGWKFIKGDQSVFYHPGGGKHGGAYYGFSSGKLGKNKIVGPDYIPLPGDKANIIKIK